MGNGNMDIGLLDYIRSKKWGNFDNKGMDLLIRSMQLRGFRMMQKKSTRKMFAEDIMVDYGDNRQLKAYSLAPFFSKDIVDFYIRNPQLISGYIKRSYISLRRAQDKIIRTQELLSVGDAAELIVLAKDLLEDFFEVSYWKYYITAISVRISRQEEAMGKAGGVLAEIGIWKNDEEFYCFESDILIEIAHFLSVKKNLGVHGWEICKYIHIDEFIDFLDGRISKKYIIDSIEKRRKMGYISLGLELIEHENSLHCHSSLQAQGISKHIDAIFKKETQRNIRSNMIFGTSVAGSGEVFLGECIIIKNHAELGSGTDLDGKILVTTMSTPKFLPYMKNVKAIVTDTGGLVCHAAIMAREFGIACIVGTNVGTAFLKSGDIVSIDMKTGSIRKEK